MTMPYQDDPGPAEAERIARQWCEDRRHPNPGLDRAEQRLRNLAALRRAFDRLDRADTVAELFGDYDCPHPHWHAVGSGDVIAWVRHRQATGRCARCGGTAASIVDGAP